MSGDNNWMWEYFKYNKENELIKCNKCDKTFNRTYGYNYINLITYIKRHLFDYHKISDYDDMLRWKNDNCHKIWQYFLKLDGYKAQCKFINCKKIYKSVEIGNLQTHLRNKHNVSRHDICISFGNEEVRQR